MTSTTPNSPDPNAAAEEEIAMTSSADQPAFSVVNPATGKVVGSAPSLTPDDISRAVTAARAAQPAWRALGFDGRARHLLALAGWVLENKERLAQTIVDETGVAWEEAMLTDVLNTVDQLRFWSHKAPEYLADEAVTAHSPLFANRALTVTYEPIGAVGVIGPWNTPLELNFGDAIPALAAGNTVLVKPSSLAPLANLLIQEATREVGWPEDVLTVVTGSGAGPAVVDNVDMVMFTGSTAVGQTIAKRAAERLIPVSLELGGSDAMIVLADANLERAANAAVYYGMQRNGQNCQAIERVYIEGAVYDRFADLVAAKTRQLRVGTPAGPGSVDLGAMVMTSQVDIVESQVREAVDRGATVRIGGARIDDHHFQPTVLTDVPQDTRLMQDETFGPVLAINSVKDAEEALALTNDSRYGLNASVWTADLARGEAIARRISSGMACVNDALINLAALELPFGGIKGSGVGTPRHGAPGIRKYTHARSLLVHHDAPDRDPHFYPYRADVTAALTDMLTQS